jgi:hypothetical protein
MNEVASSAPKARGECGGDESGSVIVVQCLMDFELEVAVVILADADFKDFIDDRQHVMERADRLKRGRVRRAEDAPGSSQSQCILDGKQRDTTIIESGGEQAVVAAEHAGASRHVAIRIEKLADVILFCQVRFHEAQP